jgi:cobalt/nickel transport system permease protein
MSMLFAVHIADGVLAWTWLVGGWTAAFLLIAIASRRVPPDDVPRIGLFAAAIFVGSQLHVPLGVTTVHLLLNGIAGIALGVRAPLAIAVGLTLQSLLFGHGGKLALGVNVVVLALPALATGLVAGPLRRLQKSITVRGLLAVAVGAWIAVAVMSIQIAVAKWQGESAQVIVESLDAWWLRRTGIGVPLLILSCAVGWFVPAKHAVGVLIGGGCALATVLLNAAVVAGGGLDGVRSAAVVTLIAHLPVIAVEALAAAVMLPLIANRPTPE